MQLLIVRVTVALLIALLTVVSTEATPVYIGTGLDEEATADSEDVIVLGSLIPAHRNKDNECSDELSGFGIQGIAAIEFVTRSVNLNSSFLPGVTLAFEIRDTCFDTNYALEQSLNFVTDRDFLGPNGTILGISGVVGPARSYASIAIANLLRLFDIPQISYASTAVVLSDKTRYDYFFRTVPPDTLQAKAMAGIIMHFKWTYVFAFHSDDVYGVDGIEAFVNELSEHNKTQFCTAEVFEIAIGANEEVFDEAVLKLKQQWVSNASVVVIFAQYSVATGILQAVKRLKESDAEFASKSFTWIGSESWGDSVPEELHSTAQGMLSVFPVSNQSREFDDFFLSLNPQNSADNPYFIEYWQEFFNCSLGNSTVGPGSKYKNMCNLSNQTITREGGYTQNSYISFTIDAVYAFAHALHNMQQDLCPTNYKHGLCSAMLDDQSDTVKVNGRILREYLYNVSFNGASADIISFDESGDELSGYAIINLQFSPETSEHIFKTVGEWNIFVNGSTTIEFTEYVQWSNNSTTVPVSVCSLPCGGGEFQELVSEQADCCWTCKPCLGARSFSTGLKCSECPQGFRPNDNKSACIENDLSYLTWSNPWSIVILLITFVGLIGTLAVIVIFIVFHKHSLIKASSRELSAVLLVGVFLCFVQPFFFFVAPSVVICTFRRFGVGFSFAVCYSALLVKTNRIHRIFNRKSNSAQPIPLISPQSQIFFTALLIAVQVVIAVIWLVVEKPGSAYEFNDNITELKCGESPFIQLAIDLVYNFILLILSTYFAFRARNIPQNFNEARFINVTLYTMIIIWLAFIPTYFSTASLLRTTYRTISLVFAIVLTALTTLICLFIPKLYVLFTKQSEEIKTITGTLNTVHSEANGLQFTLGTNEKSTVSNLSTQNNPGTFDLVSRTNCDGTKTGEAHTSFAINGYNECTENKRNGTVPVNKVFRDANTQTEN